MAELHPLVKLMQKLKDDEELLKKESAIIAGRFGYNQELQHALKLLIIEEEKKVQETQETQETISSLRKKK